MRVAALSRPPIVRRRAILRPAVNHDLAPDRRHCLRQKVDRPAFASFDGITGGMILDLSEDGGKQWNVSGGWGFTEN